MQRNSRMKSLTGLIVATALLAVIVGPSTASAQDVAVGQATATVLAVLAVTATHDLVFGDVLQGVPKTADKTLVADAGVFQVSGAGGKEVTLYMQLPDYLWNSTNEDRLVIAFSSTGADIDTTAAGTPAAHGAGAIVDQDPHNLPDTNIGATDNILQIYLGGTVYPTVDQRADAYTADIILTVAYTGS
ncbi:MAG: hypothetical protein JSU69_08060 [Candidatus Zixiibacteriota bacterium]|nr:MAG: hypothetical protein JSU69_08060 [candidate division Zixibacteria bacterium]